MPKGYPKEGTNNGWFKKGFKPSHTGNRHYSNCLYCGEKIRIFKSRPKKFCNHSCSSKYRWEKGDLKDIKREVWNKGKKGYSTSLKGKKQSKEHRIKLSLAKSNITLKQRINMSVGQTKENIFTGFKTLLNKRIRNLPEYQSWRLMVFGRDDFTCQDCGQRGVYLEAHHKTRLAQLIKQYDIKNLLDAKKCKGLWNIFNGVTLCIKCHDKKDKHRKIRGV